MKPYRVTIHCTDTPDGEQVKLEVLDEAHRARGWTGIGYHFLIEPTGKALPCRPLELQGAGVKDANEGNVHICLVGNSKFTAAQWETLRITLDAMTEVMGIKPWEIHAHHQFPSAIAQGKTCPNVSINRILAWYFLDDSAAISENLLLQTGASP